MPSFFDKEGLEITQGFATSDDGTRVPTSWCPQGIELDGKNPTLLYGYGGFEISLTPAIPAAVGRAWLAGRGLRGRQHPRRRRVRPALAPGRAQGQPQQGLRGLRRGREAT
jgi:hypothetical protein